MTNLQDFLDLHHQIPEIYWTIIASMISFGVKFLRDLAKSVAELNKNIVVIITRLEQLERKSDDHEDRLRGVETKVAVAAAEDEDQGPWKS